MSGTSVDLSQIRTDALSSAATFRTLIGVDIASFATAAEGDLAATALQPSDIASGTITAKTGDLDFNELGGGGGNSFSTIQPQVGGTSGTAVAADSSSDTLTINANCGAVISGNSGTDTLTIDSFGMPAAPYLAQSDVYFSPLGAMSHTGFTLVANTLYKIPILISHRRVLSEAALSVTAFSAGAIRLGLRAMNPTTGVPGLLVADFGTVDCGSNGTKTIGSLSVTVEPGWYYLELVANATPAIRASTAASFWTNLGTRFFGGSSVAVGYLTRSFSYAALPADETSETQTMVGSGNVPIFGVK